MTATPYPGEAEFDRLRHEREVRERRARMAPPATPALTENIGADDVSAGDTLVYPVWHDRRPAGATSNVSFEPMTVKAIVEYEHNRVLYFEPEGYAVVARGARLDRVTA